MGQEIVAGRRGFVQQLVAARTVNADGRGRNQHDRRTLEFRQPGDEIRRARRAAVVNELFLPRGPAPFTHRLTGQVKHGFNAGERVGRRWPCLRLPVMRFDAGRGGAGTLRVAQQDDGLGELGEQPAANEACRTGDEGSHIGTQTIEARTATQGTLKS